MIWNDYFLDLFDRAVTLYKGGNRDFETYYSTEDMGFLGSIGCKPREFFDFVEDFVEEGEPSVSSALLVAAARRDYFLTVQQGVASDKVLTRDDVPGFGDELEGMTYFPRIIEKAKAKLRGELDPDLMYSCGGDRNFLHKHGDIHPADFLRHVWAEGDEPAKLAAWVKAQA